MGECLIGMGANAGRRRAALQEAVRRLAEHPEVRVLRVSRLHATRPVGGPPGQGDYLNGAVRAETSLAPEAVLALLQRIEQSLGRRRGERWGPRVIDLDLLLYDQLVRRGGPLLVPHPRMAFRRFVLAPAAEVAGEMTHPLSGWTIARLLEHLDQAPHYAAVAGGGPAAAALAAGAAAAAGARYLADPAPPAPGAAGPSLQEAIESLEARARLLAARPAPRGPDGETWISDFWLDEGPAETAGGLPPAARRRWLAARRRWRRRTPAPKLIIAPPGAALGQNALRVAPVLDLRQASMDTAVHEAAAALAAMR